MIRVCDECGEYIAGKPIVCECKRCAGCRELIAWGSEHYLNSDGYNYHSECGV